MKTNKTCVAVVQYRPIEEIPPVMSLLLVLKKLAVDVHYIGSASAVARTFCAENGIPYTRLSHPKFIYRDFKTINSPLGRLLRALTFLPKRRHALLTLRRLQRRYDKLIVWSQECHSAAFLGNGALEFSHRALTVFELFDRYGKNWIGFDFFRVVRSSVIVCPEPNRARALQKRDGLADLPLVIINKPVMHPRTRNQPVAPEVQAVFDRIGERPVFLYQGVWSSERADVGLVLETIAAKRPDYCVLSMPGTDEVKRRLSKYPNAFTLPHIPAPGHLAVTSRASVGIAVYKPSEKNEMDRLNVLYCAPNKIYEYAGFGVPTLGNRLPGLEQTIGAAQAGRCCDLTEESILEAADDLVKNLARYRENANRFFDDSDVEAQVRAVLAKF